ncbi:hypothetical protein evm_001670 [Chilo suppressalis]|nr:hypothetical protein evm_001670 [Chilo suppressalis]
MNSTRLKKPKDKKNIKGAQKSNYRHELCDVDATYKHVVDVQKQIPIEAFEEYVKNLKCYKYYEAPSCFVIKNYRRKIRSKKTENKDTSRKSITPSRDMRQLKWDWIRGKRSLKDAIDVKTVDAHIKASLQQKTDDFETSRDTTILTDNNKKNRVSSESGGYETLYKDPYGIYRRNKRFVHNLKDVAGTICNTPLDPEKNVTYVMLGDTIVIHCTGNKTDESSEDNVEWKTDRKDMLLYQNVAVQGHRLYIEEVEAKNQGVYVCKQADGTKRNVKLTVIAMPTYEIVCALLYSSGKDCNYKDLRASLSIGKAMAQEFCPRNLSCTVDVVEPVCLRDQGDESPLVRLSAVVVVPPRSLLCSARCRRDLQASMAALVANNTATLASIPVVIFNRGCNKTLTPAVSSNKTRYMITHTLRTKDSRTHREAPPCGSPRMSPICPHGFYFQPRHSICVACPSGDGMKDAEHVFRRSQHGAASKTSRDSFKYTVLRSHYWLWILSAWCVCAGAARAARAARGARRGELTNAINTRGKQLVLRLNEVCDAKQRTLSEKKDALEQLAAITDHCVCFVNAALEQVYGTLRRSPIPGPSWPVSLTLSQQKDALEQSYRPPIIFLSYSVYIHL